MTLTKKENDRARRRGNCAVPGRERGGSRGPARRPGRGEEGGGKRVNRESTCKQATRETNNVGAAGCSPPNEAGRQEAGVRQPGRQATRLVYVHSVALRAPFSVRVHTDDSE